MAAAADSKVAALEQKLHDANKQIKKLESMQIQQKLDDANKQIKKLESMQTFGIFGEEFRKLMQQDADDYTKKAIGALNEGEEALEKEEETLKNKETLTKVQIQELQRQLAAAEQRIQQLQALTPFGEDFKMLAQQEAAEYTTIATNALKDAEEATGSKAVQKSRQLLEAGPSPRNAALALAERTMSTTKAM